jgi:hypothetical protein
MTIIEKFGEIHESDEQFLKEIFNYIAEERKNFLNIKLQELRKENFVEFIRTILHYYTSLALFADGEIKAHLNKAIKPPYDRWLVCIDEILIIFENIEKEGIEILKQEVLGLIAGHLSSKISLEIIEWADLHTPYAGKEMQNPAYIYASQLYRFKTNRLNRPYFKFNLEEEEELNNLFEKVDSNKEKDPIEFYKAIKKSTLGNSESMFLSLLGDCFFFYEKKLKVFHQHLYDLLVLILPNRNFPKTQGEYKQLDASLDRSFDSYKSQIVTKIIKHSVI